MIKSLAILSSLLAAVVSVAAEWLGGSAATVDRAVARVTPALVRIEVVSTRFQSGRAVKQETGGSGVIVRKDGYILTNHHVAGHATRLVCILSSNEEIEAELRTKNLGGFSLLDLHDFPGQGSALVGVVDPFWDSKGYVTPAEFHRFACETVPLARMAKRVWTTDETFHAEVGI